MNKVYIVKSDFGEWEDSYQRIDGVFTDESVAETIKKEIEDKIAFIKKNYEECYEDITKCKKEEHFDLYEEYVEYNTTYIEEYDFNVKLESSLDKIKL